MRKLDIKVGDIFGDWTVINTERFSKHGHIYVQCQCKCGTINDIASTALLRGKTSSCKSCSRRKLTTILPIGPKYKHWTVLEGPIYRKSAAYYKVQCDYGTIAYKLPIELNYQDKDFQCEKCAQRESR